MTTLVRALILLLAFAVSTPGAVLAQSKSGTTAAVPRLPDGKPNMQGIWQAASTTADTTLGSIPYLPAAAARQAANARDRQTADPLGNCYMPGVPRIMFLPRPFQIFQTPAHVAMTFEWSMVYRLIYTDGSRHANGIDFWMGDSRGHWDGDTLVVEVTNHNDKTWLDSSGDFHSDALKLTERYTLTDANTIDYAVTLEDPKVYAKAWTVHVPLHRRTDVKRLMEYECQADKEEASGAFERDQRTWYPADRAAQRDADALVAKTPLGTPGAPRFHATGTIPRRADGTPDLEAYYQNDAGGANYGLQKHARDFLTPGTRGVVVDPADGKLPLQDWAVAEQKTRERPDHGYDDPTAHCFVAGVPRSMYSPSPFQFIQTPDYLVMLFERMSWRIIPLNARAHALPGNVRLWHGDSIGRWDGDSLVVETTNLNGKTWLNEIGEIVSHAERVVERFTPVDATTVQYEATVTDPVVYTKPWTIAFPLHRQKDEVLEVACHEDNQDLQHLKDVRDAARAAAGKTK